MKYGIEATTWYSPNEIADKGLLFGKSKRYVFDLIKNGEIKSTNTSTSSKPQWKIYGQDLINFIESLNNNPEKGEANNENNNSTDEVVQEPSR